MKSIQYDSKEHIDKILNECHYCTVSLNGTDGYPYVVPMNFVSYDGRIYLHSAPHGTHISILENDNRVVLSFIHGEKLVYQHHRVACSHSMRSDSVILRGTVTFIECLEKKINIFNKLMTRFVPDKEFVYSLPSLNNVKVWVVEPESISAKGVGLTYEEFKSLQPGCK